VRLLHDIEVIFADRGIDRLPSAEICRELARREDRPWGTFEDGFAISPHRLAAMLDRFGIRPKVIRIGSNTPRGYTRDQFEDAWARYPRSETATPQHGNNFSDLEGDQSATQTATSAAELATGRDDVADLAEDVADNVAVGHAQKYNQINDVAGVALYEGESPERPPPSHIDLHALMTTVYPPFRPRHRGRRGRRGHEKPRQHE
jgi:Protein of unknown function (DUF3631)